MKSEFEAAAKRVLPRPAVHRVRPLYNGVVNAGRRVAAIGSDRKIRLSVDGRVVDLHYPPEAAEYFNTELDGSRIEHCVPLQLCDVPDVCDAVFDVGAYFGLYSALFGRLNDVPVYSYEPFDRSRRVCHKTVAANDGGVLVYGRAVAGVSGHASFHESLEGDQGHSIMDNPDAGPSRNVCSSTIGAEIRRHGSRHPFVKLDIEGGEAIVLRDLLDLQRPVSGLVEIHPDKLDEWVADELVEELESACHYCKLLGDSSPDHPMAERTGDRPNRPIYSFKKP